MNTTKYTTLYRFYFRTEDSVEKAVTKIIQLLKDYNTSRTINAHVLSISNPNLDITYFKSDLSFQENEFITTLNLIEKELMTRFTDVRIDGLKIAKDNGTPINNSTTPSKGIPMTVVLITLSPIVLEEPSKSSPKIIKIIIPPIDIPKTDLPNLSIDTAKFDNMHISLPNISKYIPKFGSMFTFSLGWPSIGTYLNDKSKYLSLLMKGSLTGVNTSKIIGIIIAISILVPFLTFYIAVFSILGTTFTLITYTQGLPSLLEYLQNINISFPEINMSIFNIIPDFFKNINISEMNISTPDVILDFIKEIKLAFGRFTQGVESVITTIPDVIKEAESLIEESVPEIAKEVISNTVNTMGDNMSSDVSITPEKDVKDNKDIIITPETLSTDENENKNGVIRKILYTILYGGLGIVAFDLMTRVTIPTIDPDIFSHFTDFVGGVASLGFFTVSTLLKIFFGNSDKDDSTNSTSNSPDTSTNGNSSSKANLLLDTTSKGGSITEKGTDESLSQNSKADVILGLSISSPPLDGLEDVPKISPLSFIPTTLVPGITLNDSKDYIELEAIYDNYDSDSYPTAETLDDNIMKLEKTIVEHTQNINEEDTKNLRGILINYGEQIRLQNESLNSMSEQLRIKTESENEKDEIIQRDNAILIAQEKMMLNQLQLQREQEVIIDRKSNLIEEKELELKIATTQAKEKDFVISVRERELGEKDEIINLQDSLVDEHEKTIELQREALKKSEDTIEITRQSQREAQKRSEDMIERTKAALEGLANSINTKNGKLLHAEDLRLYIDFITGSPDVNSNEVIIPRGRNAFEGMPGPSYTGNINDTVRPEDYVPRTTYVPKDNLLSQDKPLTLTLPFEGSKDIRRR